MTDTMNNSKILNLLKDRGQSSVWLIYGFVLFSGFSNAPGYLHSAISIPIILSFLIILFYPFYKTRQRNLIVIIFLCFLFLVLSYLLTPFPKAFRVYSYSLSHIWMAVFFTSLYIIGKSYILDIGILLRMLAIGLGVTVFYELIESYIHFIDVDLGSYLPRIERESYNIYSGFGFYRARAFNYESAYLAMYINVGFSLLLAFSSRYKLWIGAVWFVALLHTMSLIQILMFVFLMMIALLVKLKVLMFFSKQEVNPNLKNRDSEGLPWSYLLLSVLLITILILLLTNLSYWEDWALALKTWYIENLTGVTPSSITRFGLYKLGYSAALDSWPLGIGMGNIQEVLKLKGLASFYLSLVVQLGVLSVPFFLLILFFLYRSFLTKNIWIIGAFMFAFVHLLIIDTFYLPQVFLPILFAEIYLRNNGESAS
jgi:hypothetical protein